MTVETATYITDLDETNPADTALANELDDHIRLLKSVLLNTMNGTPVTDEFDEAMTATLVEMNSWDARVTALENFTPPSEEVPVFAHQVIAQGASENVVISLGFRPRVIIAWAVTTGAYGGFQLSVGAWNETDDNAFTQAFSGENWGGFAPSTYDRSVSYLSYLFALVNGTSLLEAVTVENVSNDGFEIAINTNTEGADLLYIAFPNADQ